MKRTITAVAASVALVVCCEVPAQAAGFAAKEAWSRGAGNITRLAGIRDCGPVGDNTRMLGYTPNMTYEVARGQSGNPVIRDYMSGRIDQEAGKNATMIPPDVRDSLIDLAIAGTLKKVSDCGIIKDPGHLADRDFDRQLADGNNRYGQITIDGVLSEVPGMLAAALGSSGSS